MPLAWRENASADTETRVDTIEGHHPNVRNAPQPGELLGDQMRNLDAFVAMLATDGSVLDINERALHLCREDRHVVMGEPLAVACRLAIHSASQNQLRDAITLAGDGQTVRRDVVLDGVHGTSQYFEFTFIPRVGEDGTIASILAIGVDVSVREQTEVERNLRFLGTLSDATRGLADPAEIMMVTARLLGEHMNVSRAAYADVYAGNDSFSIRHDYTRLCSSAVGSYSLDLFGPHASGSMRDGETLVMRNVSVELVSDDGVAAFRAIEVEAIICCPLVKSGNLVAMMAVHQTEPRDWTQNDIVLLQAVVDRSWASIERARAQAEIRRKQQQFEDLFEFAPNALVMTNAQGNIALVNKRAENLFGYSRREIIGQPFEQLIAGPGNGEALSLNEAFAASARPHDAVFRDKSLRGRRRDGSRFPVDISLSPVETDQGPMLAAALRDTTERDRLELQLQQSLRLETVGQLAGGIAHDFNNLLTVINATAELIVDRASVGDSLADDAGTILRAGQQAAMLTRQLLALGGQQSLNPAMLDLNEVLENIEPLLRSVGGECIQIKLRLATTPVTTRADRMQIDQVLLNLVSNCRDAMPDGGTVIFETAMVDLDDRFVSGHPDLRCGPHTRLSVTDTGCGMDEATRLQMFEPFFTTKETGQGTGLGLSTVYGIIRQSGGGIVAESDIGCGTTVTMFLPAMTTPIVRPPARPGSAVPDKTETILVVENEKGIQRVARLMLERRGYKVLVATSGAAALELFAQYTGSIDLVLSDIVMPGMSGPEFVAHLRTLRPGIKVLYMTGYAPAQIARYGLEDGRDRCLSKPFSLAELSQAIRQQLDS